MHRVPSGTFLHDVTIKRVEDDFMSELKGFVVNSQDRVSLSIVGIFLLQSSMITGKTFVFVSQIPKVSDCINIERVFPHTNSVLFVLDFSLSLTLVVLLSITLKLILEIFSQSSSSEPLIFIFSKRIV